MNGAPHESSLDPLYFFPSLSLSFFLSILPLLVCPITSCLHVRATTLRQQIKRIAVEKKAGVASSRYQLTIRSLRRRRNLRIKATMCEFVREIKPRKAQSCLVLPILLWRSFLPVNAGSKENGFAFNFPSIVATKNATKERKTREHAARNGFQLGKKERRPTRDIINYGACNRCFSYIYFFCIFLPFYYFFIFFALCGETLRGLMRNSASLRRSFTGIRFVY